MVSSGLASCEPLKLKLMLRTITMDVFLTTERQAVALQAPVKPYTRNGSKLLALTEDLLNSDF